MRYSCKRSIGSSLPEQDRFILSKGHAGAAVYAVLAQSGYFLLIYSITIIETVQIFQDTYHHRVPGVEVSTGSLGHSLGIACGMALRAKCTSQNHHFCLLSDGELDEGSNWESFLFAAHFKLSNLVIIIDYNKLQSISSTENTIALEPLLDKFRSFNLHVLESDGHNHESLRLCFDNCSVNTSSPHIIICHTVKEGVSFMENNVLWHYRNAQGDEYEAAISPQSNTLKMRSTLIHQIEETLSINSNSYLLTGDLGFGIFDDFPVKYPDQFFNCGVLNKI